MEIQKIKSEPKPKRLIPSLKEAVGQKTYDTWVAMLKELVPGGRSHRLSVLIASMLQYALAQNSRGKGVIDLLDIAQEEGGMGRGSQIVVKMVEQLFKDAKVKHKRDSSRGKSYSIIEDAMEEFIRWDNMPWEH